VLAYRHKTSEVEHNYTAIPWFNLHVFLLRSIPYLCAAAPHTVFSHLLKESPNFQNMKSHWYCSKFRKRNGCHVSIINDKKW
jgi:hypothetical protein